MARSIREIPKIIAAFGEKQFSDSGASLVEVLRVKASTIRKYFKQIKGIAYLVAVISVDRVRVYFFNLAGTLLIAENLEQAQYDGIRKKSKLVIKYEKPTPPTELELRMEATEEFRSSLSKAIRRIARYLGQKEPNFPDIYVTKEILGANDQNFGLRIEDDGVLLFDESTIQSRWKDGVVLRAAFLLLLNHPSMSYPQSSSVANAIAALQMKGDFREKWIDYWLENSTEDIIPIVNHLLSHLETYKTQGFQLIMNLLKRIPEPMSNEQWTNALQLVHDNQEVSLGTDASHIIRSFCKTLSNPRKLLSKKHVLKSIHLAPRAICDITALGHHLTPNISDVSELEVDWLNVHYYDQSESKVFSLAENGNDTIKSIRYFLNIDDVLPKSGGLISQGRSIISWALAAIGLDDQMSSTFESEIMFSEKDVLEPEKAILERLSLGDLSILTNTLIGSPQRISSLITLGSVILLPDFNHIGLRPNFLVTSGSESLHQVLDTFAIEYTMFSTESTNYAVVSAPTIWGSNLMETAARHGFDLFPIIRTSSQRRLLRSELAFPEDFTKNSWG